MDDDTSVNSMSSRFRQFCDTNPVHLARSLHHPISEHDLTRLDHAGNDNNMPANEPSNRSPKTCMGIMKCCCGRSDCAYLEHNSAALGGLERDLEIAARLGQALLDRHEAYVKESQAEQARLSDHISELEDERISFQDANHKMVVENRELLAKLEQLNSDFGESGNRIQELEDLLQDCEQEIRRLNGLTRKTQELELKMLDMERERVELTKHFEDGRTETRSTLARWKESERKVRELEQEVQKIEWAARLDRERHEEIVARMKTDRSLERELGLSEGRLKATAAMQGIETGSTQKQVVSNFVRDILQDNANLQAGIAELRELLQSSNDEVQNLREQVMLHQPIPDEEVHTPHRAMSLSDELGLSNPTSPKPVQQEVHVHHHYHAKAGSKKEKAPLRRTSRKRALMPSALSPSPSTSGASTPLVRPQRYASSPAVPVVQRPSKVDRWSMQSTATASTYLSSMASSPRSCCDRNSSIFDRIEREEDSSRPTSPESFSLSSPMPLKHTIKPGRERLDVFEEEGSVNDEGKDYAAPEQQDMPAIEVVQDDSAIDLDDDNTIPDMELTPKPRMASNTNNITISHTLQPPELGAPDPPPPPDEQSEDQPLPQAEILQSTPQEPFSEQNDQTRQPRQSLPHSPTKPPPIPPYTNLPSICPSIRRSNSHDSLLSISGMDIHLAQHSSRSHSGISALALLSGRSQSANKHYFSPSPAVARAHGVAASTTQSLATVTEYTATSRHGVDQPSSASMLALHSTRQRYAPPPSQGHGRKGQGLMGGVGGWVRGKWGFVPVKSVADLRSVNAISSPAASSVSASRQGANHATTSPAIVRSSNNNEQNTSRSTPSKSCTPTAPGKRTISATSIPPPSSSGTKSDTVPPLSASLGTSTFFGRPPGINQSGPIPGFAAAVAAKRPPVQLEAERVDVGGLKESLADS